MLMTVDLTQINLNEKGISEDNVIAQRYLFLYFARIGATHRHRYLILVSRSILDFV